jgi:phosphatidylinositol glycan class B
MLWTVIPFLFVHSIIPHKELRFLYPIANLVPIFLILSYQGVYKRYKLSRWRIIGSVGLVFLVVLNIVGLVAIASTGAGSNKTVVTEWIHRQYGDENLNIIIVNGQNPFIDWGPPKNSYYSSSKLKLDHISSIWQDDFVRHKKDGQVNLLVISYNDFTGSRADRLLRRFHIVEVYRNIPEFLIYLYEIYNPSLNDFGLKVYEFK